jgi:hypothetical protein
VATLQSLRAQLRVDLHDGDASAYRWADGELDRHIGRAVRELSFALPREQRTTLVVSGGPTRELSLSTLADLVRIAAVEYPIGEFVPCYVQFSVWQSVLTVLVEKNLVNGENVRVYWGSMHLVDDDTSTLPAFAEETLLLGAGGYAALTWASFATNRANIAGVEAVDDYRVWGAARLNEFGAALARIGERSRVRSSRLYRPADATASGDVVQWEP